MNLRLSKRSQRKEPDLPVTPPPSRLPVRTERRRATTAHRFIPPALPPAPWPEPIPFV